MKIQRTRTILTAAVIALATLVIAIPLSASHISNVFLGAN